MDSVGRIKPLYRGTQIASYILYLIEFLLGFRFILKLLGANPGAGFSDLIYTLTRPLAGPFLTVVGSTQVEGSMFEWTTLLAMVVYWVVYIGIVKLLVMGKPVSTPEASVKLDEKEQEV